MNLRTIALTVVLTIMILPGVVTAATTSIGVNVGSSEVEGWVDSQLDPYNTPLLLGAGFLYSDDDYWFANGHIAVKDEVFAPGLSLGLGFKGVLGEVEIFRRDYDVAAFCLMFLGEYDFRKNNSRLPFGISASIAGAPEALSARDTEKYISLLNM